MLSVSSEKKTFVIELLLYADRKFYPYASQIGLSSNSSGIVVVQWEDRSSTTPPPKQKKERNLKITTNDSFYHKYKTTAK